MNLLRIIIRNLYWFYRRLVINSVCLLCGRSEVAQIPEKPGKLLVLAPEGMIGDFILMSPFLKELRKLLPDTSITLAVPGKTYPLAVNCPYVNETMLLPERSIRSLLSKIVKNIIFGRNILRPKKFDAAILTTDNVDYYLGSFMIYSAGIPIRVGFGNDESTLLHSRKADLMLENLFNIRIPFKENIIHQKDIFLQLLEAFGPSGNQAEPEVWESEGDTIKAVNFFKELESENTGKRPYFAIGISAAALKRDWGQDNYKKFIAVATEKFDPFWIFVGPESDRLKYDVVFDGIDNSSNAAGKFSLTELHAVLKNCSVYVGPDSGPAHVAATSGCRVLEISCHPEGGSIYSINSPERFGPVSGKVRIVRAAKAAPGCSDECCRLEAHCILNITVDDVLNGLGDLLRAC